MKTTLSFDRERMTHDEVAQFLGHITETMVFRGMQFLQRQTKKHLALPSLYQCDIRYDGAIGDWLDIPLTMASGRGSCRELVPWRIAELRSAGTDAMVQVFVMDESFHLQVVFPDGRIEDPSRILGMP